MKYKNVSSSVKTFHGVTFKPGETKEVSRFINSRFMIRNEDDEPIEAQNKQQKKPSPAQPKEQPAPKKEEPKKAEPKAEKASEQKS